MNWGEAKKKESGVKPPHPTVRIVCATIDGMKPTIPLLALLLVATSLHADEPNHGFKVPPGFKVELYAPDALATDIFSLTIDAQGRVVVAGKNYVKALVEKDGKADHAILLSMLPKTGSHGMCFDEGDLVCNGDSGLRRYPASETTIKDSPAPYFTTGKDGEHSANAIVKGPDGWFYMIAGNDAAIPADFVNSPNSPIKTSKTGMLVRFSPDGKTREIVADGFRNPYGLTMGPRGDIFTVDSDGERIYHLPYYTPTRVFDIAYGMHHGWVNAGWQSSWAPPEWWPDVVDRVCDIGRGSPTANVVYRHRAFPQKYRGGLFSLCWTFGKLYFFPLNPEGSTYRSKTEVFLETTGDVGFAPTGMAVGPKGDLFIAIGGRGTRGSVFRVYYDGPEKTPALPTDPVRAVLAADEPLSAWSRAAWVPAAKKLGEKAFVDAMRDPTLPIDERIRAVEILTEVYRGVLREQAKELGNAPPDVTARAIWSLTRFEKTDERFAAVVDLAKASKEPRVLRAAWEAFAFWPKAWKLDAEIWDTALAAKDRRIASLMRRSVDAGLGRPGERSAGGQRPWPSFSGFPYGTEEMLFSPLADPVEVLRVMQKEMGGVRVDGAPKDTIGYSIAAPSEDPVKAADVRRFVDSIVIQTLPRWQLNKIRPSAPLAAEMARTLAMAESNSQVFVSWVAGNLKNPSNDLETDEHFLLCLAQMKGKRHATVTSLVGSTLVDLPAKYAKAGAKPSDQVPAVLDAMTKRLLDLDPNLEKAILDHPHFGHDGHEPLVARFSDKTRLAATRKLVKGVSEWSPELVALVAANYEAAEAIAVLRPQLDEPRLADPILLYLAEKGERRDDFVRALGSSQAKVVEAGATRLVGSPNPADAELVAAVKAIRRFNDPKTDKAVRASLEKLLVSWTNEKIAASSPAAVNDAWSDWFVKSHKDGDKMLGMSGASTAKWMQRIAKLDFEGGDVPRGFAVFQKRNCFRCHGDQRRLGPDLTGAAQRFSRDDLFTAIVEPSKDIAPSFESKVIATSSGKTYSGMLIYDSQELYLLQVSPDTTVRIPGSDVLSIGRSPISFMPAGLLDDAPDRELVDLYAYLRSLRK
jgi:putative heme-binding domain-containing protein